MTNTNATDATQILVEKLKRIFNAAHVEVIDNSWQHAGHIAMENHNGPLVGTHIVVCVVSEIFEAKSSVSRHRMIQKALAEEFSQNLHALQIMTFTPAEWQSRNQS